MVTSVKYCSECGSQNERDAVFCVSCGRRFDTSQAGLGENMSNSASLNQGFKETGPFPQKFSQSSTNFSSAYNNLEVSGLIDASVKLIRSPKKYALKILADPNSPSSSYYVYIRALLVAIMAYLEIVTDSLYDELQRETVEAQFEGSDISMDMAREFLSIFTPVLTIIYTLGVWYIGSTILGILIRRRLHHDSPLQINTATAMRKLNGYRQIPRIMAELIILGLLFVSPVSTYIFIGAILGYIAEILFAIILWRSLGEHVGYFGGWHKTIAAVVLFFAVFGLVNILV